MVWLNGLNTYAETIIIFMLINATSFFKHKNNKPHTGLIAVVKVFYIGNVGTELLIS